MNFNDLNGPRYTTPPKPGDGWIILWWGVIVPLFFIIGGIAILWSMFS